MSGLDRSRKRRPTATMLGMADRIRSLRFHFDRSQVQFASLVGVAPETVCAWELGDGIEREALVQIADSTGASLHWLISGLSPTRIETIRAEAARSLSSGARTRDQADSDGARLAEGDSDFGAAERWGSGPVLRGPGGSAGSGPIGGAKLGGWTSRRRERY